MFDKRRLRRPAQPRTSLRFRQRICPPGRLVRGGGFFPQMEPKGPRDRGERAGAAEFGSGLAQVGDQRRDGPALAARGQPRGRGAPFGGRCPNHARSAPLSEEDGQARQDDLPGPRPRREGHGQSGGGGLREEIHPAPGAGHGGDVAPGGFQSSFDSGSGRSGGIARAPAAGGARGGGFICQPPLRRGGAGGARLGSFLFDSCRAGFQQ